MSSTAKVRRPVQDFMNILKMIKVFVAGTFPLAKPHSLSEQDMIDRFLFVQALDTLRCYEEGVLESVIDANVGSILVLALLHGQAVLFSFKSARNRTGFRACATIRGALWSTLHTTCAVERKSGYQSAHSVMIGYAQYALSV